MWVAAGAGVGGGSLIYASVSVEAKAEVFQRGWPPEISYEVLKPYYDRVGSMLDIQILPDNQLTERCKLMQESAQKCGWGERFHKVPLAVSFDPEWHYGLPDARNDQHSKSFVNAQGRTQGTCVHCGNCDIGCQVSAKNTLDLNYLALAENKGAEIRPLHLVMALEPHDSGWLVHIDRIEDDRRKRETLTAQRVIVSAGSIGSTELLLRCRDVHRTLPALSTRLGQGWAFNGDFVTPTFFSGRKVSPTHGPTITSAIDLLDYVVDGQALFIEDGGVPNLAADFIKSRLRRTHWGKLRRFWKELAQVSDVDDPLDNMMPWFGQGVDAADGRLYMGRLWYAPWRRTLKMHWDYRRSEAMVEAMVAVHKKLSAVTGGDAWVPPTWTVLRNLITPHPLGGCNMGITAAEGVVDAGGKVFGYDNLFVMDGSIIPRAIGLNPSRTIAALAELNIEKMCRSA
jgi:cholesterol oxidase